MEHGWTDGSIRVFDDTTGIGSIDAQGMIGGCWFDVSMIEVVGPKTLRGGQQVRFTYHDAVSHAGFSNVAVRVKPAD